MIVRVCGGLFFGGWFMRILRLRIERLRRWNASDAFH